MGRNSSYPPKNRNPNYFLYINPCLLHNRGLEKIFGGKFFGFSVCFEWTKENYRELEEISGVIFRINMHTKYSKKLLFSLSWLGLVSYSILRLLFRHSVFMFSFGWRLLLLLLVSVSVLLLGESMWNPSRVHFETPFSSLHFGRAMKARKFFIESIYQGRRTKSNFTKFEENQRRRIRRSNFINYVVFILGISPCPFFYLLVFILYA